MSAMTFEIGARGVDAAQIVRDVEAAVAARMQAGAYTDPRIARAERTNLRHLAQEANLAEFYLDCLRESIFVDITDFEIRERRRGVAFLLVALKRTLWKLLRFYTYRLWTQQNEVNGLLMATVEEVDRKYRERLQELEARLARLEAAAGRPPGSG
jgi:hypothetical protein